MENNEALTSISKQNYINSSTYLLLASKKIKFLRSGSSKSSKFYTEGNESSQKKCRNISYLNHTERNPFISSKSGFSIVQNKVSHSFQEILKSINIGLLQLVAFSKR